MSKIIESQMEVKGYVKVSGIAIVGDVAVAETSREVLAPVLSTQLAVNVFNNEFSDGWQLYRKRSIVSCGSLDCDI